MSREKSEEPEEELAMFTQDNCPHCKEVKEALKEYFESGDVIELNLSKDPEAQKLADELEVETVPTFISIKGKTVCKLDFDFKPVSCSEVEEVKLKKKDSSQSITSS